jgi:hypothetical protein
MEYMDRCFCAFYSECWHCAEGPEGCARALTPLIRLQAEKAGLPICQFTFKPECFKEITK